MIEELKNLSLDQCRSLLEKYFQMSSYDLYSYTKEELSKLSYEKKETNFI